MKPQKQLRGQRRHWLYVKVGISVNPEKRRAQFQTGLPFKLKILNTYKYSMQSEARKLEKRIHRNYKKYKTKQGGTEWLYVPKRILNEIQLDLRKHDHTPMTPWQQLILRFFYGFFGGKYTEQVEKNSAENNDD